MRWQFIDPTNQTEVQAREAITRKLDWWWQQFAGKTQDLRDLFKRRSQWDLPAWMHEHLGAIHPELMWEYGPAIRGEGHRLVITPESQRELQPLVTALLARAPTIDGWEFYPYRVPESTELAEHTVRGRTGGSLKGMRFVASIGEHNRVDLVFQDSVARSQEEVWNDAFVAIETLLGEEVLNTWIGAIEVDDAPHGIAGLRRGKRGSQGLPMDRLKPTVDALTGSILDQLPAEPRHIAVAAALASRREATANWALYEMNPEVQEEYAGYADLFVGVTNEKDLWLAEHSTVPFCSCRYSRHGETFAYLKIDGRDGLDTEKFADRGAIEDAIEAVLALQGLGCRTGGGTGRVYSYVDLVLTDVPRALPVIRKRLREGNIHKRSWLLFFDQDLTSEWVGIWDDTPVPPGMIPDSLGATDGAQG